MTYRTSTASSLAIVLALGALLPACSVEVNPTDNETTYRFCSPDSRGASSP